MLVEIPDVLIDFMREMPEQKETEGGKPSAMRKKNVLGWISHALRNGTAPCGIFIGLLCGIMRTAQQEGYIRYDPRTHTWKGVDYGDDQFLHADGAADLYAPGETGEGGQRQAGVL